MRMLSEEELVRSIVEQTERSSAVIAQTDLSPEAPDPAPIIVSSLSNIFDSALIVTALEDSRNDRSECYKIAAALVLAAEGVSSDAKRFIRQISEYRSKFSLDGGNSGFSRDDCLDFLNAYDCFMFEFFKKSPTVKAMTERGEISECFVSFRNILEKLIKKEMLARREEAPSGDLAAVLAQTNRLLEQVLAENKTLNKKIDDLSLIVSRLAGDNERGTP